MKTIWKMQLENSTEQGILVPLGATPLSVQNQYGVPHLWMLVDPSAPKSMVTVQFYTTGGAIPEDGLGEFVGTVQNNGFVGHVFWKAEGGAMR
jgi:hypothetical protein